VIDAAKGIEAQTRKLFEVCRHRGIPIFTFMNKLDRPAREPLELLDELEKVLHLEPYAMNWPLGMGADFRGLFDRRASRVHLFERTPGGAYRAPVEIRERSDALISEHLAPGPFHQFMEEADMLDAAGPAFDPAAVGKGAMTPVYFGSAMNNFGIGLLLEGFLPLSRPPASHRAGNRLIEPDHPAFSGFIF